MKKQQKQKKKSDLGLDLTRGKHTQMNHKARQQRIHKRIGTSSCEFESEYQAGTLYENLHQLLTQLQNSNGKLE